MLVFALLCCLGPPSLEFEDISNRAGIEFRFESGSRGRHDLVEIMGGGVGLIDIDNDGRLDLYLTNGGPIGEGSRPIDPPCRLYKNLGDGSSATSPPRPDAGAKLCHGSRRRRYRWRRQGGPFRNRLARSTHVS